MCDFDDHSVCVPFGPSVEMLEALVRAEAESLGISTSAFSSLLAHLSVLAEHSPAMYAHSLRVGLYAARVAVRVGGVSPRLALMGGCAHDAGKHAVPVSVLEAEVFGAAERAAVSVHPQAGFDLLSSSHLFSALVAGLHHSFQSSPYGIDLDASVPFQLSPEQRQVVLAAAELVSVCDFFDALTTRRNDRGLVSDPSDRSAVASVMAEHFPSHPLWVAALLDLDLASL